MSAQNDPHAPDDRYEGVSPPTGNPAYPGYQPDPTHPAGHTPGQPVGKAGPVLKREPGESLEAWDLRRQRDLAKRPTLTPAEFEKTADKNNYTFDKRYGHYVRTTNLPADKSLTDAERRTALIDKIDINLSRDEYASIKSALHAEFNTLCNPKTAPGGVRAPAYPGYNKTLTAAEYSRLSPADKANYVFENSTGNYVGKPAPTY